MIILGHVGVDGRKYENAMYQVWGIESGRSRKKLLVECYNKRDAEEAAKILKTEDVAEVEIREEKKVKQNG